MSARRQARAEGLAVSERLADGFPEPLRCSLHPAWEDSDRIRAEFVDLLVPTDEWRLVNRPRLLYGLLLDRWAERNGYSTKSGGADFHKLRAAGLLDGALDRARRRAQNTRINPTEGEQE